MKVSTIALNLLASVAVWSGAVSASDLMTLDAGKSSKEGVNISTGGTSHLNNTDQKLVTVGSGLRKKKVVLVPIKVYVAQLLVNDAARFVKTDSGALPSIENQTTVAMHLTFLRDVPAANIKESFQVSLDANGVSATDPDIARFMNLVDEVGAAEANGSLAVIVTKNADGSETLGIENKRRSDGAHKDMKGSKGLAHKIMSIWLGTPADDYLAELKAELLQ